MKKMLGKIISKILSRNKSQNWTGSVDYWERRYERGGNSGAGSYNRLAEFKAEIINKFVKENEIDSVVEWGCGDGNQLSLAEYPHYVGIDVAQQAVNLCQDKFKDDKNKQFIWSGSPGFFYDKKADLALSLDVIYHLVEDETFDLYMRQLFESSKKFVCIYSCNDNNNKGMRPHVRHRKFTDWIDKNYGDNWEIVNIVKNKYPYDVKDVKNTSWSDFYFYANKFRR